jgi:serine/threonine-protein kinase
MTTNSPTEPDNFTVIGNYRIIQQLGAGGMGAVYEVEPISGGEPLALKLFSSVGKHADFLRKRFIAEGKILSRLNHPSLVKVHDIAFDEKINAPYFTMDIVLGPENKPCTLENLRRNGKLNESTVTAIYDDLRSALVYLHEEGIVHRDVKLENVLIDKNGHAILSDFGVSRILKRDLRKELAVTTTFVDDRAPIMGSAGYLSPELKAGEEATPASDAYALGVLVFRLLTGMWYEEDSSAMELLVGFNPSWKKLLEQLLALRPAHRLPIPPAPKIASKEKINSLSLVSKIHFAVITAAIACLAAALIWFLRPSQQQFKFDEFFPPEKAALQ